VSGGVTRKNIDRRKRRIAAEKEPEKRRMLEDLLAQELLKLSDAAASEADCPK
jgi:hypothetical protein